MTAMPARSPGAPRGKPQRSPRKLSDAELAFIVETHGTLSAVEQARQLDMDYDCLCWRRGQMIRQGLIAPATRAYAPIFTAADRERIRELAQAGYSVTRIGRALGRSYGSIVHEIGRMGGIKALRSDPLSRVRTPAEVGMLFDLSKRTIDKWVALKWIGSSRNTAPRKHRRRTDRLITDDAILLFMERREHWPAWDPSRITDADWRDHAKDLRAAAGGEWLGLAEVAQRTGLRYAQISRWFRTGRLAGYRVVRYGKNKGYACYIWSADVDAITARMRQDPRTGRAWSAARRQKMLGGRQ